MFSIFFYFQHWISPCEVKQPTLFCRIPSYLNLKQITRKTNLRISRFILCFSVATQYKIALIKASSKTEGKLTGRDESFRATKLRQDKSCYGGAKTELVCPGRDASHVSQPASMLPARGPAGTAVQCGAVESHAARQTNAMSLFALRATDYTGHLIIIYMMIRIGGTDWPPRPVHVTVTQLWPMIFCPNILPLLSHHLASSSVPGTDWRGTGASSQVFYSQPESDLPLSAPPHCPPRSQ